MNADGALQVLFAGITLVAITALTARRWRFYRQLRASLVRRLVLVDLILFVAALEFFADALADSLGDLGMTPARLVAIVLRGALAAASVALLASFPGSGKEIVS